MGIESAGGSDQPYEQFSEGDLPELPTQEEMQAGVERALTDDIERYTFNVDDYIDPGLLNARPIIINRPDLIMYGNGDHFDSGLEERLNDQSAERPPYQDPGIIHED